MTAKSHHRRPLIGEWRLVEMALWDRSDLDLRGPAYLTLDPRGQGTMRFLAMRQVSIIDRPFETTSRRSSFHLKGTTRVTGFPAEGGPS